VALKRYSGAGAVFGTLFAVGMVIASWVFFEGPYATLRTMAAIGPFIGVLVALGAGFAVAFSSRKPIRPANYPRIEHLRIAGNYQAAGAFGETGISPLRLRR
jgi:hypothetical protein